MKSFVRVCALLAFAFGLMASVATSWVTIHLADEDGFVETTAVISANEQVRSTVINVASAQLAAKVPLGPAVSNQVASLTAEILTTTVDTPEFGVAWNESMRRAHGIQFADDNTRETLTIDLAPFVDLAIDQSKKLTALGVSAPDQVLADVSGVDVGTYVTVVRMAADNRLMIFGVTIVAGLVALLATPGRSLGTTVSLLGAITVVVTLVSAYAARASSHRMVDEVLASHREWAGVVRPIGEILIDSMDSMLMPVGAVGLIVAAGGVAWRAVSARQR